MSLAQQARARCGPDDSVVSAVSVGSASGLYRSPLSRSSEKEVRDMRARLYGRSQPRRPEAARRVEAKRREAPRPLSESQLAAAAALRAQESAAQRLGRRIEVQQWQDPFTMEPCIDSCRHQRPTRSA